jgi:hypothetical protein
VDICARVFRLGVEGQVEPKPIWMFRTGADLGGTAPESGEGFIKAAVAIRGPRFPGVPLGVPRVAEWDFAIGGTRKVPASAANPPSLFAEDRPSLDHGICNRPRLDAWRAR